MAHASIDERREAVRQHFTGDYRIKTEVIKELSQRFNCSPAAIRADIASFIHEGQQGTQYISSGMRLRIRARDKDVCQYCGSHCEYPVVDHVRPYFQGGKAKENNLVVACWSCNSRLAGKTEEQKRSQLITNQQSDKVEQAIIRFIKMVVDS